MAQVELLRKTVEKDGKTYKNWVIIVDGKTVPIKPLFQNDFETLLEYWLNVNKK